MDDPDTAWKQRPHTDKGHTLLWAREREQKPPSVISICRFSSFSNGVQSPTVRFVNSSNYYLFYLFVFGLGIYFVFGNVMFGWFGVKIDCFGEIRWVTLRLDLRLKSSEFRIICRPNFWFEVRRCLVADEILENERTRSFESSTSFLENQIYGFGCFLWSQTAGCLMILIFPYTDETRFSLILFDVQFVLLLIYVAVFYCPPLFPRKIFLVEIIFQEEIKFWVGGIFTQGNWIGMNIFLLKRPF